MGAHVHCQVSGGVIWVPERGLHCLWKPGHCHTTSLAPRRNGIRKLLKWSNSLLVEVTGRENVFYFSLRMKAFWGMPHGLHSYSFRIFKFEIKVLLNPQQKLFCVYVSKMQYKILLQARLNILVILPFWAYLEAATTDDMQLLPCCSCHSKPRG